MSNIKDISFGCIVPIIGTLRIVDLGVEFPVHATSIHTLNTSCFLSISSI